jgi:hypothetical protein
MPEVATDNAVFVCTDIPVKYGIQSNNLYPVFNPLPDQLFFKDECLLFVACFRGYFQCALLNTKQLVFNFNR